MLVKISESIAALGLTTKVAAMSNEEINDFLLTVPEETFVKAAEILKGERSAGFGSKLLGTLLTILAISLPSVAGPFIGEKLEENKGKKLTIEQIKDFKNDIPKESLQVGKEAVNDLNKLITQARRAEVDPNFSGFAVIGGEKLMASSKEELAVYQAIANIEKKMSKHLNPEVYKAQVAALVQAAKSKKEIKFS